MFIRSKMIVPFLFILALGCSRQEYDPILIYAGASMTAPLSRIANAFSRKYNITIIHDFQGSGSLAHKIVAGSPPHVYIPASTKWSMILAQRGYIDVCIDFAANYPVIITAKNNMSICSLKDLCNRNNSIAVGDPGAASIGHKTMEIFKMAGIDAGKINIKARGMTVKQLVRWVEWGSVDAAIVWNTDALESGKLKTIFIDPQYYTDSVIPVCTMKGMSLSAKGRKYLAYLQKEGKGSFAKYGFKVIGNSKSIKK